MSTSASTSTSAFAGGAHGSALSPTGSPAPAAEAFVPGAGAGAGPHASAGPAAGAGAGTSGAAGAGAGCWRWPRCPAGPGNARTTSRADCGHRRLQEVDPAVRAFRIHVRGVRSDGLVNARGHAAQLRQEHHRVDTGPLKADELAGRLRPVLAPHQHGQDFAAEVAAELAGRPARRRLLPPSSPSSPSSATAPVRRFRVARRTASVGVLERGPGLLDRPRRRPHAGCSPEARRRLVQEPVE